MMDRRAFMVGAAGGALALSIDGCSRNAWPQDSTAPVPIGFTRLRVVESTLTVGGKTGLAYRIQPDDGTLGYTGAKGQRFQVALENGTPIPLSIHWHGLILSNGQDGVPYVTQAPLKPGERRLYDFPIVQAGTYWMHSHFGLQEQPLMTAPLILRDPGAPRPEEQDVVVMLNDFTTRDAATILADLQKRQLGGARGAMGSSMKMAMAARDLNDVTYDAFRQSPAALRSGDRSRAPWPDGASQDHQRGKCDQLLRPDRDVSAPRPSPSTGRTSPRLPAARSGSRSPSASTCV